ncbi:tellurium resistance protein TerA [Deinococcus sp. HMF7620]|uniref:Tellurium resistance protein TerA n=1 Tax=Deinococcus arboris TaxID=2682977 RepID=A0A7C9M9D3_9DEIO|nr:TerD family protein [Deinococcus arboris]MVN87579.1 tellurium resistance protein TerA [Deinococcus arboris]
MLTFQTGQKSPLNQLTSHQILTLSVRVTGPAADYDLSLFGLDPAGKLSDDRYLVFYNQPATPEGAVQMHSGVRGEKVFQIDLTRLPHSVRRLSLTASVDAGTFGQIDHAEITLSAGGQPVATYRVTGRDFQQERAVMLLDIYFKDMWRVGAVGQGFNGGLDALVKHYGGTVSDRPAPSAPPPSPPPAAAPAPSAPSLNLKKVTLEKKGESTRISLKKSGHAEPIRVNLNWDRGGKRGGLLGRAAASADLDLGCMFLLNDGTRSVIQALGNRFGSERLSPHILLDKDDRTGAATDGENLTIFRPDLIHTVLVFACIYEGTNDFTQVGARLSLKDTQDNEILMHLSNPDIQRTFCGIALIENIGGDIRVTKEERYFFGHQDCDEHYGFGFNWVAGSK